ncbi:MAG: hypothetical protein JWM59_3842 [Verrucomicrobiales bacterium]|nr:hypothetical protein [Verrucomicrobiales bacterium]
MTSTKSYNLHAGILMTVLVASAFVVHRHAKEHCLVGASYAAQEAEVSGGGERAADGQIMAGKP